MILNLSFNDAIEANDIANDRKQTKEQYGDKRFLNKHFATD